MGDPELLKYYMGETNRRLNTIDRKLEQLIGFRWMLMGVSATISTVVGLVIALYFK